MTPEEEKPDKPKKETPKEEIPKSKPSRLHIIEETEKQSD